jgi:hypothetical protein
MRERQRSCPNNNVRSWFLNLTQMRYRKRGLFHTWGDDDSLFRRGVCGLHVQTVAEEFQVPVWVKS